MIALTDTQGLYACLVAAAAITVACRKPADQTWAEFLGMTEEGW